MQDEFDALIEKAEECEEDYEEYRDFVDTQEELGEFNNPSWVRW